MTYNVLYLLQLTRNTPTESDLEHIESTLTLPYFR